MLWINMGPHLISQEEQHKVMGMISMQDPALRSRPFLTQLNLYLKYL